ncbi:hypothetical protein [Paraflavitalea sp. CAU 1676]|uniref:hypothetical protein n=1 Tax=Paraflavitalea sp. CAU 1676 TaxID=3032598 RepID=UPI0023DA4F3E|nr:hypothetical protein [Paraflavitalea sp. CAU 1676]MDF2193738.1 hypothetical protein [Paraflavitalea sp. CAU 1676]
MAKPRSSIFRFQGTIEDVTHVKSKRYGDHTRARKNSKTPFVMTEALAESKARLQECNGYARPVFQAMRAYGYHGGLWSDLVSRLFAELKAGRPMSFRCWKDLDCNLPHKLGDLFKWGYDFSATRGQNELRVQILLKKHPFYEDHLLRTGYQVRVVCLFLAEGDATVHKQVAMGPLTTYDGSLEPVELSIPLSATCATYLVMLGITPHTRNHGPTRIMSDTGIKVVAVG